MALSTCQRVVGTARKATGQYPKADASEAVARRTRERRRRHDFCHKTAHQLAHNNALVVLEKLPVSNMTRRAKPVADPAEAGPVLTQRRVSEVGVEPGHPV